MKREELEELHYIAPITNLPSIHAQGILSHRRTKEVPHYSVAMAEVQERRARVVVPGGLPLHAYANLYFCARNPMLYKRLDQHDRLCIIRVSPTVLDLPGVVMTDGNASSKFVRFAAAPGWLEMVDRLLTFAERWTDPDQITYWRKGSAKCAEVLVPELVEPRHLMGLRVSGQAGLDAVLTQCVPLPVEMDPHLFFRGGV